MATTTTKNSILVCTSKATVPAALNSKVLDVACQAVAARGAFTMALSGGSLAAFLSSLKQVADDNDQKINAQFEKWHIILADERCVALDDKDSNLGCLTEAFLSKVPIPASQIHGINQDMIATDQSAESLAVDYEAKVRQVIDGAGKGALDLAVLGFGPDGHTCSLFPDHPLLAEKTKWVASIENSPKPPPKRVTLTFKVLNQYTRHVIFCGAGKSKSPILQKVIASLGPANTAEGDGNSKCHSITLSTPPPYPCAMVQPSTAGDDIDNTVVWIVDQDAMDGVAEPSKM